MCIRDSVVAPQKSEAKEIIIQTSSQNQADIYLLDEIASWSIFKIENKAQHGVIFTSENEYKIKIPLLGRYQFENAAIACVVSEVLNKKGFKISKKSIVSGISIVDWPGRMQILSTTNYQILVDGAHNLYSIEHLVKEVKENFCYKTAYEKEFTSKVSQN